MIDADLIFDAIGPKCPACGRDLVTYWDGDDHGAMCVHPGGCGWHAVRPVGGELAIVTESAPLLSANWP